MLAGSNSQIGGGAVLLGNGAGSNSIIPNNSFLHHQESHTHDSRYAFSLYSRRPDRASDVVATIQDQHPGFWDSVHHRVSFKAAPGRAQKHPG